VRTSDFDFELPPDRIAREPLAERDASRLMVLPQGGGPPGHRRFRELPSLLQPGDLLVLNETRVIPARLRGRRTATGGQVELLLCEPLPAAEGRAVWRCLGQASKPLRTGVALQLAGVAAEVVAVHGEGFLDVAFAAAPAELEQVIERAGELPLPPYLGREETPADRERYQTVYARSPGAVAAPTAGLHFTERVLAELDTRGIRRATLTLHVGPGTFLPVRGEDLSRHRMHAERYEIPGATAAAVRDAARVIAVGTTSLRALEASGGAAGPGSTALFITPGHEFRVVDALLTNFHLPRSTLVMLVSALAGRERLLAAYAEAVREGYRFYSYGDAMLVNA
jgi:S-adenosylmethionine:tRNA ribosyltransferase-isomerase